MKFSLYTTFNNLLGSAYKLPALGGLIILTLANFLGYVPFQDKITNFLYDSYLSLDPRERISAPVTIIEIDEKSLAEFGQWPWPRSLLATLISKVGELEPAAIGIDIIMPEPDRMSPCQITEYMPGVGAELKAEVCKLPSNDVLLAETLQAYKTVIGTAGLDAGGAKPYKVTPMRSFGPDPKPFLRKFSGTLNNIEILDRAARGHALLSTDIEDGIVRSLPMIAVVGDTVVPTLSLEMLRLAVGASFFSVNTTDKGVNEVGVGGLFFPTFPDGRLMVNYSPHDPGRFVSASDVLNDNISEDFFKQKLILVGFSGLGLVDYPTTPLGERVPGVEIHAQILESIFDESLISKPEFFRWIESILLFVLGILIVYVLQRINVWKQLPLVVIITLVVSATGYMLFSEYDLLFNVATPLLFFLLFYTLLLADSLIADEEQIELLEIDLRTQREKAAKVQGEMEAAKRFQTGILPDVDQLARNLEGLDLSASMEPARMVGGDLYDCFMLDDDHLFFSVGDVCGKGVPASLFMVISKTLCKSVLLSGKYSDSILADKIKQANREISRDNPEMLFVTIFIGILNINNGELTFCNAGHEKPLIASPNAVPYELEALSGPPLGAIDEFDYKVYKYRLSVDEYICIITDGITEALNSKQELFGKDRLVEVLNNLSRKVKSKDILELITEKVADFVQDEEAADDLTIMIVNWKGKLLSNN